MVHFYTAGSTIDKIEHYTDTRVDKDSANSPTTIIRKYNIRDDINFRNMISLSAQQGVITTFSKWMVALDSCATVHQTLWEGI